MPTAGPPPTPWASSATTTPSSGTRATTSSRASRVGAAGTRRVSACASCSRSATTSTRAASSCTRASTPGTSTHPGSAPSATTHSTTSMCSSSPAISPRCRPTAGLGRQRQRRPRVLVRGRPSINDAAGIDPDTGDALDVVGALPTRSSAPSWASTAPTAPRTRTTTPRSSPRAACCPVADYPQFDSTAVASYDRVGGPFEPHTGDPYVYSQIADITYKRLTRTIDVPAAGGSTCRSGPRTTPKLDWDHVFVEAQTVGQDDWTTLPDANGHTTPGHRRQLPGGLARSPSLPRPLPDPERRRDLLAERVRPAYGMPRSGPSAGWQQWEIDLDAYAGDQIEVSISLRQ